MKIVFLGTPDFAVLPLKRIIEEGKDEIVGVVCNLDKPVGRKQILTPPPVKELALKYNIPVFQYKKIREEGLLDMKNLNADLFVTCAFGQILSQELLDIPKHGVINIHGSLLPELRGASPIQSAILEGKKKTGITIMKTDIGIDTGDILLQKSVDIKDDETGGELFDRLSILGADCIIEALDLIRLNKAIYTKQDDNKATVSKIIKKEDGIFSFNENVETILNKIKAFNPWPIAQVNIKGEMLKVYKAEKADVIYSKTIGEVLSCNKKLIISCFDGAISLLKVQKSGGNVLDIKDYLNGAKINLGDIL